MTTLFTSAKIDQQFALVCSQLAGFESIPVGITQESLLYSDHATYAHPKTDINATPAHFGLTKSAPGLYGSLFFLTGKALIGDAFADWVYSPSYGQNIPYYLDLSELIQHQIENATVSSILSIIREVYTEKLVNGSAGHMNTIDPIPQYQDDDVHKLVLQEIASKLHSIFPTLLPFPVITTSDMSNLMASPTNSDLITTIISRLIKPHL